MNFPLITAHRSSFDTDLPLARQVYDNLHHRITALELEPYRRLSEEMIANELGVSRTPVREALARLADQRLVDVIPQRGTFVSPMRIEDLEASQFMREAIEMALLRRAVTTEDRDPLVKRLRAEIKLQDAFFEVGDIDRFYRSDEDFHAAIADHVRMASVFKEVERAKFHTDRFRRLMISGVENVRGIIDQHCDIVDAIEAGDVERAENFMLSHLRRVLAYVDKAKLQFPGYFEGRPKSFGQPTPEV